MDIDFFQIFDVDSRVVDKTVVVGLVADNYYLVGSQVVDTMVDFELVGRMVVVDIQIVDSLMMVMIVDTIDPDSSLGKIDYWQLVMVVDIVQPDYVQKDYSHRFGNEDGEMVVDAETITKEMVKEG